MLLKYPPGWDQTTDRKLCGFLNGQPCILTYDICILTYIEETVNQQASINGTQLWILIRQDEPGNTWGCLRSHQTQGQREEGAHNKTKLREDIKVMFGLWLERHMRSKWDIFIIDSSFSIIFLIRSFNWISKLSENSENITIWNSLTDQVSRAKRYSMNNIKANAYMMRLQPVSAGLTW